MRIALSLGFVLISASTYSFAQGALPAPVRAVDGTRASAPSACPLDMRVRQGVGAKTMAVDRNGRQMEMFAARLILLLKDARREQPVEARMVGATVTVHGTTARGQVLPADTRQGASGEVVKTLEVRLTAYGEPEVSGDLLLPGFTSARMVDLESVTYDDGSTWRLSGTDTCHVAPDLLMPVKN
ncbi:MAG TPA: hypothetical protein VFD98_12565 [Terracidiphilus sp.]|jgi:hypothetical protein|nr:hypothetical protein [Terracidiphilus sp.]